MPLGSTWSGIKANQPEDKGWFESSLDWMIGAKDPAPMDPNAPLVLGSTWSAPTQQPADPGNDMLGGMVASTISSIPEMFGMETPRNVQAWRDEHPVADLVSTIAGTAIPYVGAEVAFAKIPRAARALDRATEGTLAAFGSTGLRSPVAKNALSWMYAAAPVDLARLGTGYALDADMGEMFTDVALSQALAGSLGGVVGFLRAGGKAISSPTAQAAGSDLNWQPTFEYRFAQNPESKIVGDMPRDQYLALKRQEVLQQVPAKPAKGLAERYVYDIDGATPETSGFLESLFKPNKSSASPELLAQQPLDIRQLHTDGKAWSVGEGTGDAVAKAAGFNDLDDLAAHVVYPRVVQVNNPRIAGTMQGQWKKLIEQEALQQVADDTWMFKEQDGLFGFIKRVERGPEPVAKKAAAADPSVAVETAEDIARVAGQRKPQSNFGPLKMRQGDRFLIGKTDKIERVAPEAHKLNKATMAEWAKYRDPFRQLASANPIAQQHNSIMRSLSEEDYVLARKMRRGDWVKRQEGKLAQKVKAEGGIAEQASVRELAEGLYDIAAPKLYKMQKNTEYGRLYSLLEGGMRYVDTVVNQTLHGSPKSAGALTRVVAGKADAVKYEPFDGFAPLDSKVSPLNAVERQQFMQVSNAQFPAESLDQLIKDGLITPNAADAVRHFQTVNEHMLQKYLYPALKEAGMEGQFEALKGFVLPRKFEGDFLVRVTDEGGKLQWMASGATPLEAQTMAKLVVEEAGSSGKKWVAQKFESKAFKGVDEADNLEELFEGVTERMAQSSEAQQIVQKAMRRAMAENTSRVMPGGKPATMKYERTGVGGSPDVRDYSAKDIIETAHNHYSQLLRYASYHTWRHRFGHTALKFGEKNEREYTDLMRKASQWLGIEGKHTQVLNNLLRPVLGNVLGSKPATRIAQETGALMHAWNLGILNPTYAVLNLLQPLMTTVPWIAFMQKAPTEEAMRMMQVLPRVNAEGRVAGSYGVLSPIKVITEATGLIRKPTDELRQFVEQGMADGTLGAHIKDAWMGPQSANSMELKEAFGRSAWDGIKQTATLMSTRSEQYSRLVSFNAAYLVGRDMFKLSGDQLYRFVRKGTETTMYGYSVMDRSRVLTGPLGSMMGLFKNFQFHYVASMAQYGGAAIKDGVWSPMLWQGGSALAIGGLGATPLVMMADGLAKWAGDSPDSFHWLEKNWGKDAGDALYFGLPSLLGVSLQASSTMPGTDVVQDVGNLGNAVFWERAKAAGAAVGAAWDYAEGTGQNPLKDTNIRDQLLNGFAPRAMIRAFSATEGDYVKSMKTGMPSVRDLPVSTRVLHGLGINQTEIERHYIAGERMHKLNERRRDAVQDLGEAFYQAQRSNDIDSMTEIYHRAMASGVDGTSVLKSAQTRYNRYAYGDQTSRYSKEDQAVFDAQAGE